MAGRNGVRKSGLPEPTSLRQPPKPHGFAPAFLARLFVRRKQPDRPMG